MAATGTHIHEIERDWYAKRAGVTYPNNATLLDMKRTYWAKVVGASRDQTHINDLEFSWLKSLTGVGAGTKTVADMWREAVVGAGVIPSNSLNENKILYYQKTT